MHNRSAVTTANVVIGVLVLAAIVVGIVAVLGIDPRGRPSSGKGGFDRQLEKLQSIDPALIRYQQTGQIRVPMRHLEAVAVGPGDRIYVGGDKALHVFRPDGTPHAEIALTGEPKCLAVGGTEHTFPGRIYVGMTDHVQVLDAGSVSAKAWQGLGQKALLTSIAVAEEDVFAADAGNRIVWRYDTGGRVRRRIGDPDPRADTPGFVITSASPYFDLAVYRDGLLRVVNPRAMRIEAHTFDGHMESFWGQASPAIEGFFGCCNPSHFTVLSDGRFVTVEKGVPRVKVYDGKGRFECVVAGPEQLSVGAADAPPDVAADRQDRVLVLDHKARCVRIFQPKPPQKGATP